MKCPVCNNQFIAKSHHPQIYCSIKCQRIANRKALKAKYEATKITPNWTCQNCGFTQKLNFYPIANAKLWLNYKCKKCGHKAQALTKT